MPIYFFIVHARFGLVIACVGSGGDAFLFFLIDVAVTTVLVSIGVNWLEIGAGGGGMACATKLEFSPRGANVELVSNEGG